MLPAVPTARRRRARPPAVLAALVLLAAAAVVAAPRAPRAADICPQLDGDVRRAMAGWQVPGLAIGAVADGKTVLQRTYGVRDVDTGAPVTPHTLFALGSLTKSLTALAVALAEQDGLLRLDDPVRKWLPAFPAGITLRHLLSHRAGWPRHDALWYLDAYGRRELADRLALLPRFAAPGAAFQYNNVPFAAAGVALGVAAGESWDRFVRRRILDPAGMAESVTSLSGFRNGRDRASPYFPGDPRFPGDTGRIAIPLRDTDPVAPAAGLYAPLADMLRYVALFAGDGAGVLPAAAFRALRAPETRRYGLGLNLSDWHGHPMVFHPGVVDGYGARLTVFPDSWTGIVVLSNMSGATPVAQIVTQAAADCLLGLPRTDWVARFGGHRPPPPPKPGLPAAQPLDRPATAYTGSYAHPAYGTLTLAAATDGRSLAGTFHSLRFTLVYAGDDRWRLTETHWPLREGLIFAFSGLADGRFARLATPLADGPTYRHNAGPMFFSRTPLH